VQTKRCCEIIEPNLVNTHGFGTGCSITDQIFTLQKFFEKSWEHAKVSTSLKHSIESFRKSFREICGSTELTPTYRQPSHCAPAQNFVSAASTPLNIKHCRVYGAPISLLAVTAPFHIMQPMKQIDSNSRVDESVNNMVWFIVSYDSANKQKHNKSHRMQ